MKPRVVEFAAEERGGRRRRRRRRREDQSELRCHSTLLHTPLHSSAATGMTSAFEY
jgi:hypothetical protein